MLYKNCCKNEHLELVSLFSVSGELKVETEVYVLISCLQFVCKAKN